MLFSYPTAMPMQLMGPLAGASPDQIKNLQTALTNLATATQRPQINPGAIDGVVGTGTVTAVVAALDLIKPNLPSIAELALVTALSVGASTDTAKNAVSFAAVPLTVAANTAAVKFAAAPTGMAPFIPAGFFTSPTGIAVLVLGALVVYKLFFSNNGSAQNTGHAR